MCNLSNTILDYSLRGKFTWWTRGNMVGVKVTCIFASQCISTAVIWKGIISSRLGDPGHNRQYTHSST